jgi:hypothetical protein
VVDGVVESFSKTESNQRGWEVVHWLPEIGLESKEGNGGGEMVHRAIEPIAQVKVK